jgi:sugar/nucleoside kinase (ribokinase family)
VTPPAGAGSPGANSPGVRSGVVCLGSVVVDVGKVIDGYPPLDGLAMIGTMSTSTGGPGVNLAVDLRRLGASFPIALIGVVGDDEHGRYLVDRCREQGLDTAGVRVAPGLATSFTDAMVERDGGRRTFFHLAGANAALAPTDLDLTRPAVTSARILHCGAPGVHARMDAAAPGGGNGWSAVLAAGRAAGLQTNLELVTLDPQRQRELALPCLPHLDSLIVNELEAGALTGIDAAAPRADGPVNWPALEAVALGLIERGVHRLAVVHFPAGCVAATGRGRTYRQGSVRLPRDRVVSTTGAGDAFAAGVVLGLHDDRPVQECLRLGAASAAACVGGAGTSDGIAAADVCLAAADAAGYRSVE